MTTGVRKMRISNNKKDSKYIKRRLKIDFLNAYLI